MTTVTDNELSATHLQALKDISNGLSTEYPILWYELNKMGLVESKKLPDGSIREGLTPAGEQALAAAGEAKAATITWLELMTRGNKVFSAWLVDDCELLFDGRVVDSYDYEDKEMVFTKDGMIPMWDDAIFEVRWLTPSTATEPASGEAEADNDVLIDEPLAFVPTARREVLIVDKKAYADLQADLARANSERDSLRAEVGRLFKMHAGLLTLEELRILRCIRDGKEPMMAYGMWSHMTSKSLLESNEDRSKHWLTHYGQSLLHANEIASPKDVQP